jgi:hypothetical protein
MGWMKSSSWRRQQRQVKSSELRCEKGAYVGIVGVGLYGLSEHLGCRLSSGLIAFLSFRQ